MINRYVYFFISIVVGLAIGLYFGLVVSPIQVVNSSPNILREDYKSDYVLMVAEAYTVERDLGLAVFRLERLGGGNVLEKVTSAIEFGSQIGYTQDDIQLMIQLAGDLRDQIPITGSENN